MKVVEKKLSELRPYEKNPRHNDEAVKFVKKSIEKFGFKVPIVVDKDGVIVAGHTRYKASLELGLETVPCVVAYDLTEKQIKAFRLADNKTGEKAYWNFDLLNEELLELNTDFDMGDFGFVNVFDSQDDDEDDDFFDDEEDEGSGDEGEEEERTYRITYELVFNSEEEQRKWYDFINFLKRKYPDCDTISERVVKEIEGLMGDGEEGA